MTVIAYALIFFGLTAVSTVVFFYAARGHDESQGKNKEWMVGWRSWFFYAGISTILSLGLHLSPWIGFPLGAVAGLAGTIGGFLIAWYGSPNGIK